MRTRWLFFDSTVAWSFLRYGRDRVKKIDLSAAHPMTGPFRNSLPLSKPTPTTSNGIASTPRSRAFSTWTWALLRIDRVNVQPVCTHVRFSARANSPFRVGPQCATVSPSQYPGSASTSSPDRPWPPRPPRRRALSRLHPVTATTASSNRPRSFFEALT